MCEPKRPLTSSLGCYVCALINSISVIRGSMEEGLKAIEFLMFSGNY